MLFSELLTFFKKIAIWRFLYCIFMKLTFSFLTLYYHVQNSIIINAIIEKKNLLVFMKINTLREWLEQHVNLNFWPVVYIYICAYFTVEIREIREIRVGSNAKDFEKLSEDARRKENSKCFLIYYGSEFRLRTIAVIGERLNQSFSRNEKFIKIHCPLRSFKYNFVYF